MKMVIATNNRFKGLYTANNMNNENVDSIMTMLYNDLVDADCVSLSNKIILLRLRYFVSIKFGVIREN